MTSKLILFTHTFLFASFISLSLVSSFILLFFPHLFPGYYLLIESGIYIVVILGSWHVVERTSVSPSTSPCFLTRWENNFREKEKPGSSYSDQCIEHYALKWFNLRITPKMSMYMMLSFIVLPLIAGFISFL